MKQRFFSTLLLASSLILSSVSIVSFAQVDDEGEVPPTPRKQLKQRMDKMDANKDGQIDLNEYLSHAEERFRRLDADGDGFITKDERRSAHREMRKKVRERREKWREKREQADLGDDS